MFNYLLKSAVRYAIRAALQSHNTPERIGARGERLVRNALSSALDEDEYTSIPQFAFLRYWLRF